MKTPLMLDTKRFAIHDGPGIRTTFFVKGCPLKCRWCHNPESISTKQQLAKFQHKCKKCPVCTMDETTCPGGALKLYGKPATIPDLVKKAMEDRDFYEQSGGGVTLSGGEPLLFWEWTLAFFKELKANGITTALDTSLFAPPGAIKKLLPVTDYWLPDFKADDAELHFKLTGVRNHGIKKNLAILAREKAWIEVRMPIIPGCNDSAENLAASDSFLHKLEITRIVKLKYYDYARTKYAALGMEDTMPPNPDQKEISK